MNASVLERLERFLTARQVPFELVHHEPVYTSEEAARVRGTSLASGAKALICKADDEFRMFVMPAHLKLANKRVRAALGARRLRFATKDEVLEMTGLRPGSIPPFGSLFGLPTCCDEQLAEQTEINFNAGDHSISIRMAFEDYRAAELPQLGHFADPPEAAL